MAAGVGITLTASHTIFMAESTWTPGQLIQAEDRCLRIGQEDNVTVIYPLVTEFDHELYSLLLEKMVILAKIIEGKYLDQRNVGGSVLKDMAKRFGLPLKPKKKEDFI